MFCPLSETEILIAGGTSGSDERNDVLIFNTEDHSVSTVVQDSDNELRFWCRANQSAPIFESAASALIQDYYSGSYDLIKYTRDDQKFSLISMDDQYKEDDY